MYNRNKSYKHKLLKRKYTKKRGGAEPFESDIPSIEMEESFNLDDHPSEESFALENSNQSNESFDQSNGPLELNQLNISEESNTSNESNDNIGSFGNWENPDYSGNTTFESFLSEPSIEEPIGGKRKTKIRKGKNNKKTRKSKKSKKIIKRKGKKSRKMYRKRRGGAHTDTEDTSPPAYNESYDEAIKL